MRGFTWKVFRLLRKFSFFESCLRIYWFIRFFAITYIHIIIFTVNYVLLTSLLIIKKWTFINFYIMYIKNVFLCFWRLNATIFFVFSCFFIFLVLLMVFRGICFYNWPWSCLSAIVSKFLQKFCRLSEWIVAENKKKEVKWLN